MPITNPDERIKIIEHKILLFKQYPKNIVLINTHIDKRIFSTIVIFKLDTKTKFKNIKIIVKNIYNT